MAEFTGILDRSFARMGRDAVVYGIASALTAGLGFVILLFATRIVTPAQYGTIELYRVTNQFVALSIVMGMDIAQSIFYFKTTPAAGSSRESLNGSLLQFRILWGGLTVAAAAAVIPWAMGRWHGVSTVSADQLFFVLAWCWALEMSLIPMSHFRLSARPLLFGFFSVAHTLISGIFAVAGMIFFQNPVTGYLAGFAAASWLILLVMLFVLRREIVFWPLQPQWWGPLVRFGAPFLISAPFLFGLQTADRWFIVRFLGHGELGVYAVGAQFAAAADGVVNVFLTAWSPSAMAKLETSEGPRFFRSVARYYLGAFSALAVGLTLAVPMLIRWTTPESYRDAAGIVRILLWVPILHGFFYLAVSGIWKHQKTLWITVLHALAFGVNVTACFLTVPRWGIVGAACSTLLSFIVLSSVSLWLSERLWKIHYPIMIFLAQLAISLAVVLGIVYLEQIHAGFFWRAAWTLAGMGALILLTFRDELMGGRHEGQLGLQ